MFGFDFYIFIWPNDKGAIKEEFSSSIFGQKCPFEFYNFLIKGLL